MHLAFFSIRMGTGVVLFIDELSIDHKVSHVYSALPTPHPPPPPPPPPPPTAWQIPRDGDKIVGQMSWVKLKRSQMPRHDRHC